jgi:CelD/BcsL family acetyltransferase involved in cellulose biosynthesis
VYNSGLRQKFMEYSPGIVLLAENIREAIEQGYELFDFLRGNEDYKYRMGGENTEIFMLKAKLTE